MQVMSNTRHFLQAHRRRRRAGGAIPRCVRCVTICLLWQVLTGCSHIGYELPDPPSAEGKLFLFGSGLASSRVIRIGLYNRGNEDVMVEIGECVPLQVSAKDFSGETPVLWGDARSGNRTSYAVLRANHGSRETGPFDGAVMHALCVGDDWGTARELQMVVRRLPISMLPRVRNGDEWMRAFAAHATTITGRVTFFEVPLPKAP